MKQQIARISLVQTAKVAAVLYFVLALIGTIGFLIVSLVSHKLDAQGIVFVVLAPFFYALFGFVFVFIGAWIYNQVARVVGGIEFELTESRDY